METRLPLVTNRHTDTFGLSQYPVIHTCDCPMLVYHDNLALVDEFLKGGLNTSMLQYEDVDHFRTMFLSHVILEAYAASSCQA